jgi:adenosylhomocysteine nucleosidase
MVMSADSLVLIVTAMPEERNAIVRRSREVWFDHPTYIGGSIGDAKAVIASTGDGALAAQRIAGALCDAFAPVALVGAGVAGALSSGLAVGDLVVGRRIWDSRGEAPAPNAGFVGRGVRAGAMAGTLVTRDRPAVTKSEKEEIAQTLQPDGPAAVDMESAAWARVAGERGIPYVVVRSISDAADEEMPSYLARSVGPEGRIRRGAVVGYSLLRPATIPALWRMRRRTRDCAERLAAFLERFFKATA